MEIIKRKLECKIEKIKDGMRVDLIDNCRVSLRFPNKIGKEDILINLTKDETDKLRGCLK